MPLHQQGLPNTAARNFADTLHTGLMCHLRFLQKILDSRLVRIAAVLIHHIPAQRMKTGQLAPRLVPLGWQLGRPRKVRRRQSGQGRRLALP